MTVILYPWGHIAFLRVLYPFSSDHLILLPFDLEEISGGESIKNQHVVAFPHNPHIHEFGLVFGITVCSDFFR